MDFSIIRRDEPLYRHSTFRVGGVADFFAEVRSKQDIIDAIQWALNEKVPYFVIGRGTNVLFADKGFRGLIIKNSTSLIRVEGLFIAAEGGVLTALVIKKALEHNLAGLEPLYGLPGSIGAAVWGNAGVPGCELKDFVQKIEMYNGSRGVYELDATQILFEYRHTSLQDSSDVVLEVVMKLVEGDAARSRQQMAQVDINRRNKQPTGFSCGSFFKNPRQGLSAGYLIDQAGLKGASVGDAQISEKHANFFMNRGKATCAQLLELARLAKEKVRANHGVNLEMEVKLIGDL